MKMRRTKYYMNVVRKDSSEATYEVKSYYGEEQAIKAIESTLEEGTKITKVVKARGNHLCKYCHGIVEGTNKDLLCDDCYEAFGHKYFSEL